MADPTAASRRSTLASIDANAPHSHLPVPSSAVKGLRSYVGGGGGGGGARASALPRQSALPSRYTSSGVAPGTSAPRSSMAPSAYLAPFQLADDNVAATPHHPSRTVSGTAPRPSTMAHGRQSILGSAGRQSVAAPTPSGRRSLGRQSVAPTSMPQLKGAVPSDPRPIRSRQFGEAMKERIFNFLQSTGFVSPNFTLKNVQNPTQSQVMQMFRHIYHVAVEPRFRFSDEPKKEADDVLTLMTELRYPLMGELSKTKIASAGSQQNWPVVCAMLDWLVCLAGQFEDTTQSRYGAGPLERDVDAEDEEADDVQLHFFPFLWKCYEKFWQNEDTFPEELAELEHLFQQKNAKIVEDVRLLEEERAKLVEEVGQYTRFESPLKREQDENEVLRGDMTKFQKYQDEVLTTKLEKNKKIVERLTDAYEEAKRDLDARKREREELSLRVASQKVSSEDWEDMMRERDRLTRQLEDVRGVCETNRMSAADKELTCTNLQSKVEEVLQRANALARDHGFFPFHTRRGLVVSDVDVVAHEETLLTQGVSVSEDLKPLLTDMRAASARSLDRIKNLRLEADARSKSLDDEAAQLRLQLDEKDCKLQELDLSIQALQETQNWTQAQHSEQMGGLRAEVARIERATHEERAVAANRLEVLRRSLQTAQENDEAYRRALHDEIVGIVSELLRLKESTDAALDALLESAERTSRAL